MSKPGQRNSKTEIVVGAWYVPTTKAKGSRTARWVLGIEDGYDGEERVRYSTGGEHHFVCLRTTFVFWIRRVKAEKNLELPIYGNNNTSGCTGAVGAEGALLGDGSERSA